MNDETRTRRLSVFMADASVAAILLFLSRADLILSSLFHGSHSLFDVFFTSFFFTSIIIFFILALSLIFSTNIFKIIIRIFVLSVSFYFFLPAIKALSIFPEDLDAIYEVGLTAITLVISWSLATKMRENLWRRMRIALVIAGLMFIGSPIIVAGTSSRILVQKPTGTFNGGGTVVLLLDELNADAGEQISSAIAHEGGLPETHHILTIGEHTINVIPEIFGGQHMPQARVCTPTAVCDKLSVFDFSKLHFEPSERMHIVGFYFPYCKSSGLVSCATEELPSAPLIYQLLCSFGSLLPGWKPGHCDWFEQNEWLKLRANVRDATFRSPFWQKGGTLYAHLPYPHPPGALPNAGLAEDYADNVRLAGEIAAHVWRLGYARFGEKFRLIITSDHPLRSDLYCNHQKYRKTGCGIKKKAPYGTIPYITVGNSIQNGYVPESNGKLFKTSPLNN